MDKRMMWAEITRYVIVATVVITGMVLARNAFLWDILTTERMQRDQHMAYTYMTSGSIIGTVGVAGTSVGTGR